MKNNIQKFSLLMLLATSSASLMEAAAKGAPRTQRTTASAARPVAGLPGNKSARPTGQQARIASTMIQAGARGRQARKSYVQRKLQSAQNAKIGALNKQSVRDSRVEGINLQPNAMNQVVSFKPNQAALYTPPAPAPAPRSMSQRARDAGNAAGRSLQNAGRAVYNAPGKAVRSLNKEGKIITGETGSLKSLANATGRAAQSAGRAVYNATGRAAQSAGRAVYNAPGKAVASYTGKASDAQFMTKGRRNIKEAALQARGKQMSGKPLTRSDRANMKLDSVLTAIQRFPNTVAGKISAVKASVIAYFKSKGQNPKNATQQQQLVIYKAIDGVNGQLTPSNAAESVLQNLDSAAPTTQSAAQMRRDNPAAFRALQAERSLNPAAAPAAPATTAPATTAPWTPSKGKTIRRSSSFDASNQGSLVGGKSIFETPSAVAGG